MIHSDAPDPSLTLEELKSVINSALLQRSFVFSRWHATARSKERNISVDDVVHICLRGEFTCTPRYENQNWIYEVVGKDLDGETTTVIIAVDNEKCWVTVITFY